MGKFFKMTMVLLLASLFCFSGCDTPGQTEPQSGTGSSEASVSESVSSSDSTEPPETSVPEGSASDSENEPKEENREVDGMELIQTLKSTPYRSAISNTEYGLSDASAVGADEAAFTRVLYPVPENGFEHVYDAADYGVAPGAEKNERDLNGLLKELQSVAGLKKIVFQKGVYTFTGTIELKDVEDLYFVGDETEFVFSNWCVGYSIENCKNVHMNDISTDYDPSPVVAGEIKTCDVNAKTVTISLTDEFDLSDSRYNGGTINYGSYMEFCEDENGTLYPNADGNLLYNSTGDRVKNIESGSYNASANELTLTFKTMKAVKVGTKVSVAFTMYEYATFNVKKCEGVYLEGCNVYCSAGMTFMFHTVKNSYLNRTNLMLKEGSDRLMTATADGFHGNDCVGDLIITGSVYENSHDDSINICSFYKNITANYAKEITCTATSSTNFPIEEGDIIEIYAPATFELYGTYTVKDVHKSLLTYTLTVDKFIRDDLIGKIVGNVTRSPKVKINDCIFRNKRNRGILLQSRDSDISNNTFQNIVHGGISLHSALDIFAEALVPGNVTVTNNKFINNNAGFGLEGDVSVFAYGSTGKGVAGAIKNITVKNNFIYGCAQAGVSLKSAGNSEVLNNLFYNTGLRRSSDGLFAAVRVVVSEEIKTSGNCAVMDEEHDVFSVVKTDGSSVEDTSNTFKLYGGKE